MPALTPGVWEAFTLGFLAGGWTALVLLAVLHMVDAALRNRHDEDPS